MFTQCPNCQSAFRVTAKVLQQAAGRVQCGGCDHTFNAVDHLSEEQPALVAEAGEEYVSDTGLSFEVRRTELLKALDDLSGSEDIRIEDTGVEWRVLNGDEELDPATPASEADGDAKESTAIHGHIQDVEGGPDDESSLSTDDEVKVAADTDASLDEQSKPDSVSVAPAERRYDDSTPLPDYLEDEEYDGSPTYVPDSPDSNFESIAAIETRSDIEDGPVDLHLDDPDEWIELLDEVADNDSTDSETAELPIQSSQSELSADALVDDEAEVEKKENLWLPVEKSDPDGQSEAIDDQAFGVKDSGEDDDDDYYSLEDEDGEDDVDEYFTLRNADDEDLTGDDDYLSTEDSVEDVDDDNEVPSIEDSDEDADDDREVPSTKDADDDEQPLALEASADDYEALHLDDSNQDDEVDSSEDPDEDEDQELLTFGAPADDDETPATEDSDDNEMAADHDAGKNFGDQISLIKDTLSKDLKNDEKSREYFAENDQDLVIQSDEEADEHDLEIELAFSEHETVIAPPAADSSGHTVDKKVREDMLRAMDDEQFAATMTTEDGSPLFETIVMEGDFVRGSIEFEPSEPEIKLPPDLENFEEPKSLVDTYVLTRRGSGGNRFLGLSGKGMMASALLLFVILAAQYIHTSRGFLATYGSFNQTIGPVYRVMGSPVTPAWDIKGWQFETTNGTTDESEKLLTIYSRISNRSEQALPFPLVHVSLTDRLEEIVGSRVLGPKEYLAGNQNPRKPVAAGAKFTAVIVLATPSAEVTGFKLNVCYRLSPGRLSCAIEDFKN